MTAKYPVGLQVHSGRAHRQQQRVAQLPTCQSLGGAPTSAEPMCYDATTLVITKSSKTISVSGLGLANGNITFG